MNDKIKFNKYFWNRLFLVIAIISSITSMFLTFGLAAALSLISIWAVVGFFIAQPSKWDSV